MLFLTGWPGYSAGQFSFTESVFWLFVVHRFFLLPEFKFCSICPQRKLPEAFEL